MRPSRSMSICVPFPATRYSISACSEARSSSHGPTALRILFCTSIVWMKLYCVSIASRIFLRVNYRDIRLRVGPCCVLAKRLRPGRAQGCSHFRGPAIPRQTAVVVAVQDWLDQSLAHPARDRYLRWEAMGTLAETENPLRRNCAPGSPLDIIIVALAQTIRRFFDAVEQFDLTTLRCDGHDPDWPTFESALRTLRKSIGFQIKALANSYSIPLQGEFAAYLPQGSSENA